MLLLHCGLLSAQGHIGVWGPTRWLNHNQRCRGILCVPEVRRHLLLEVTCSTFCWGRSLIHFHQACRADLICWVLCQSKLIWVLPGRTNNISKPTALSFVSSRLVGTWPLFLTSKRLSDGWVQARCLPIQICVWIGTFTLACLMSEVNFYWTMLALLLTLSLCLLWLINSAILLWDDLHCAWIFNRLLFLAVMDA